MGLLTILFSGLFKKYYQDRDWAVNHQVDHFKKSLFQFEDQLSTEIKYYQSITDTGGLVSLLNNGVDYHKSLEEQAIGIYIYEDENLKFWSSNKLVIPPADIKNGFIKTNNGFYLIHSKTKGGLRFIAQFFLKKEYDFENSYVSNSFNEELFLKKGWKILAEPVKGSLEIILMSGDSFHLLPTLSFIPPLNYFLICLEILGLIAFLLGMLLLSKYLSAKFKFLILLPIFILIRFLLLEFTFPYNLNKLEIFNPKLLAFSTMVPSLGDFLMYVVFILTLTFSFLKGLDFKLNHWLKFRNPLLLISFIVVHLLTWAIIETVEGLVLYSEIPLDLSKILSVEYTTVIALFCLSGILSIYLIICWKLIDLIKCLGFNFIQLITIFIFTTVCFISLGYLFSFSDTLELAWSLPIFILLLISYFKSGKKITFKVSISLIFLFSLMITQSLRDYSDLKNIDEKKILLSKLGKEKDLIAEYLYKGIQSEMICDEKAQAIISDYSISDQDLFKFFKKNYFSGFWDRFDLQVNPCLKEDSILFVNAQYPISCQSFFDRIIKSVGQEVSEGLYLLKNDNGRISYLGLIEFENNAKVYFELDSKFKPDGVGFPTLLLDKQVERKSLSSKFSFAHFKNGELLKQKGNFLYSTSLDYYKGTKEDWTYFEQNETAHLVKKEGEDIYFLSEKITGIWDQMAFYSYLFAFFSILTIASLLLYRLLYGEFNQTSSFKTRFQSVIVFILFFSTLFIGIGSVYYLKNQYNQKNFDAISEKIKSVKIEVEHKVGGNEKIEDVSQDYIQLILEKFSKVFFTDINLYDVNGKLISSSQNKIFEKGLSGKRMNPLAMYQMLYNSQSQFVQIEDIEGMQYLSAYVPFFNNEGHLLAYLNLPYFARSNDLKNEISNFIVALLNIYALLIVVAMVIGLMLTNRITEPLRLIQEKMGKIQLGQTNELINYKGKDEVGKLVKEYNRMVVEITESAERMAESEREDAWREMAKQVAHEIKNPLTPMKLSVQHLQMRWGSFTEEERSERFRNFGKNLITQIDTLSAIATEFSSFAKLPETSFSKVNINDIIKSSVDIYNGTDNVQVRFDFEGLIFVNGDKDQLIRVFNNLIKNAIQAIPEDRDGYVLLQSDFADEKVKVTIQDNGKGISKEDYSHIFVPNFTTKSSGMGLGLAMVQKIIENMGGEISFESKYGIGTTFTVVLPLNKE